MRVINLHDKIYRFVPSTGSTCRGCDLFDKQISDRGNVCNVCLFGGVGDDVILKELPEHLRFAIIVFEHDGVLWSVNRVKYTKYTVRKGEEVFIEEVTLRDAILLMTRHIGSIFFRVI